MKRYDALIILVLFSGAVGSAWCAMMYQQEMAAYFGLGLLVCCGAWHEAAEESTSLENTKRLPLHLEKKMIIDIQGVPLAVEHDFDDGELYISSVMLHGYELDGIISQDWLGVIYDKVIAYIEEQTEEAKFENAIDNWDAQQ